MLKYGRNVKLFTSDSKSNWSVRVGILEEMAVLMDLKVGDYVYMEIQIENDDEKTMKY